VFSWPVTCLAGSVRYLPSSDTWVICIAGAEIRTEIVETRYEVGQRIEAGHDYHKMGLAVPVRSWVIELDNKSRKASKTRSHGPATAP